MQRVTRSLWRTSRRSPGGWTQPVLTVPSVTGPKAVHPTRDMTEQERSPAARASSAAGKEAQGPSHRRDYSGITDPRSPDYNWRADRSLYERNAMAMREAFAGQDMSGFVGGGRGEAKHGTQRRVAPAEGTVDPDDRTWLGGAPRSGQAWTGEHDTNADTFQSGTTTTNHYDLVDRQTLSVTHFLRMLMDATVKPRAPDNPVFGGDGATERAENKETLKSLDSRIVPFAHEELMCDYLKNISVLHAPSGQECSRQVLRGRIVGLLFFSESDGSLEFMQEMRDFTRRHTPDFLCVCISMGGKEMRDLTRNFGFFHCTHRDGATWVTRDCGMNVSIFSPLPQLIIVNGTTGLEITRRGWTAVRTNPTTCLDEWKRGDKGYESLDLIRAWM